MADTTLDGQPSGNPFNGSEITAFIQNGVDVSKSINELLTFINAAALLGNTNQVNGLNAALVAKQALSTILTALAALDAAVGFLAQTDTNSFAKRVFQDSDSIICNNPDGVDGDPSFEVANSGVTPGTYGSASDSAVMTLGPDGRLIVAAQVAIQIAIAQVSGLQAALDDLEDQISDLFAQKLSIAANLSDLDNAGAARTNLGLGTAATQNASALTRTNDTNVTLTLNGTTSTALLQAIELVLGWAGQLSAARGGTGVNNDPSTATFAGNLNFANSFTTSGNFPVTQTYTGATNVTFPTSGTLATLGKNSRPVTGNFTLAASDNGGVIYCNSATAITGTLPKQATAALSAGFNCHIVNINLGDVTITHEAGDIFESPTLLIAQNAQMQVTLEIAGTPNTWIGRGGTLFFGEQYTVKFDGTAANGTFIACGYLPADCVVIGAKFGCTSGTGVATSNLNAANITNGALSITSTTSTQSFTGNNTGSAGQVLQVTLSSVSSLTNAWVTFIVMRRL